MVWWKMGLSPIVLSFQKKNRPFSMTLGKKTSIPIVYTRLMLPRCKTGKRFRPAQQQEGLTFWYCWWNKSCTRWCSRYPSIHKVLYIPGDAGFLPPTEPHAVCMYVRCFIIHQLDILKYVQTQIYSIYSIWIWFIYTYTENSTKHI